MTYSKLGGVAKVSRKLMSAFRAEAFLHGLPNVLDKQRTKHEYWVYDSVREDLEQDGLLNGLHPFSLAAKVNSADTPTFHEAMSGVLIVPNFSKLWMQRLKDLITRRLGLPWIKQMI